MGLTSPAPAPDYGQMMYTMQRCRNDRHAHPPFSTRTKLLRAERVMRETGIQKDDAARTGSLLWPLGGM